MHILMQGRNISSIRRGGPAKWVLHIALFADTPAPKFKWGVRGGLLPVVFSALSSSRFLEGRNFYSSHRLVYSL